MMWGGDTIEDNIAEAEQAVSNGTLASNDDYPYVGWVDGPYSCSGILITPGWVLTADHCIFGAQRGSECGLAEGTIRDPLTAARDPYKVHFFNDPSPTETPLSRVFEHTEAVSGQIRTILGRATDSCSDEDSSLDLALIRLDKRVPLSLVTPKHPSTGFCSPLPEITGTVIGYGPTSGLLSDGTDDPQRNYAISDGWTYDALTNGTVYTNRFTLFTYEGPLKGDSGGPLIETATGNLCGVSSRFYPALPGVGATMAALNSAAAQQLLNDFIFDRAGNYLGECSTGPLSLRDVDSDNDLIPDACDPCPDVPEPIADGQFLDPVDFDADGVPDACDICPSKPNPYVESTHKQLDADDDGVGDVCDLCPHSDNIQYGAKPSDIRCCSTDADCGSGGLCFPADSRSSRFGHCSVENGGLGGRCSGGVDLDGDLIGETCDPCPGTFSPTKSDMDGDGVGDECDDCPGSPLEMHPEDLNEPCSLIVDNYCNAIKPGSICVPPHVWGGATSTPRCSKGVDNDLDGVGDRCDNCKTVLNPYEGIGLQPNCNIHSEMKLGVPYPYNGDACDPMPCADLDAFTAPACNQPNLCLEPEEWPWVKIAYSTNLLPKSKPNAFQYPSGKVPAAGVGIRRCKCGDFLGGELNVTECDKPFACPVEVTQYNSAGNWDVMDIQPTTGPDVVPPLVPGPFLLLAQHFPLPVVNPVPNDNEPGFASAGTFNKWADWHNDEMALSVPTQTVLWSHVITMTQLNISASVYNDWANHYEMGAFGMVVQAPSGSFSVLEPSRWLLGPLCPACPQRIDIPIWVYDPLSGRIMVQGDAWEIDLTAQVASTLPILAATNATWLPVAETANWVSPVAPRLAVVSADGSNVLGAFVPDDDSLVDVIHAPTAPPGSVPAPAPRTAFGGVLSAFDNAVFVMGGVDTNGQPMSDLWRYDLAAQTWLEVSIDGPMPHRVLAATFRPEDRSLYVIDEKPMGNGNAKRARVIRIHLGTRQATVLADVPRNPLMNHVFISDSPKGELLLVGSSSTTNRHFAVRLALTPAGSLLVNKGFSGQGVVVRQPTLTERGATLPLAAPGNAVKNKFIHARDLHPGTFHPIGSCL